MREVAHPLRADSMPEEVRRLLGIDPTPSTAAVVEKTPKEKPRPAVIAAPANPAISAAPPGEMKPGGGSASREPTLVLPRDPALSGLVLSVRPRPPRPASGAPADKEAQRQPASAEAKPAPSPQATARTADRARPTAAVR